MGAPVFPGGIDSPFSLILYSLGPHKLAFGIIYVELLKMMLTGIFFYLYLRISGFSKYVSIAGGLMASFIGYIILGSSGWYGHSTNVVYFFLLLYSFELFYQKNNPILFPVAIFFVAENSFRLYLYSVFLFTYVLFKLISDDDFNVKKSISFLLKLAGLGAIGVGMCAVFSFGGLLDKINSPRVSGNVGATGSLMSLPVFQLPDRTQMVTEIMRFFSNDLMGTGSHYKGWGNYLEAPIFYSGLLPLLLTPQAFLIKNTRKRVALGLFFFVWMIPLVFPFFRHALYMFMGDYYKHGLSMFIPAIMLLFGLQGIEIFKKGNRINYIVLFITLAFLLTILYLPYFKGTQFAGQNIINKDLRVVVSCFLIAYTGILCFLKFDKTGIYVKSVLMALLCVELGWFSYITVNDRTALTKKQFETKTGYNDYTVDAINYLKSVDSGFYRINKDYSSSLAEVNSINDAAAQGYFGTPSYSSFNKLEYIDFLKAADVMPKGVESKTRWSIGLLQRPFLQAVASVKYNLLKNVDLAKKDIFFKLIYKYVAKFGDVSIFKNKFFLPMGFTYDQYITRKDYASLSKTDKDMAMFCAVVADNNMAPLKYIPKREMEQSLKKYTIGNFLQLVDQKRKQAMKMTSFSQNYITGTITVDRPKLVFFSIPIDQGWKAFDNGRPVPLIRANIGFMGVLLDKGEHHIELKYHVRYLSAILTISILSLIIYLLIVFACRRSFIVKKNNHPSNSV